MPRQQDRQATEEERNEVNASRVDGHTWLLSYRGHIVDLWAIRSKEVYAYWFQSCSYG